MVIKQLACSKVQCPITDAADENGHKLFFFSKAFEPILRHELRDKMTPPYLGICFMTCWHTKLLQNDRTCQMVIKTIRV